jgi:hypothetical protein
MFKEGDMDNSNERPVAPTRERLHAELRRLDSARGLSDATLAAITREYPEADFEEVNGVLREADFRPRITSGSPPSKATASGPSGFPDRCVTDVTDQTTDSEHICSLGTGVACTGIRSPWRFLTVGIRVP